MHDLDRDLVDALAQGRLADPFALLGPHPVSGEGEGWVVRVWLPWAARLELVHAGGSVEMVRTDERGLFQSRVPGGATPPRYRLIAHGGSGPVELEDPYRFGPVLPDEELDRIKRTDGRIHQVLGAHVVELGGVQGVRFAVWAPTAERVSVVGDFNGWNPTLHPMRHRTPSGVWEIFLPGVRPGAVYKYALRSRFRTGDILKADPVGFGMEVRPATASVVVAPSGHVWSDAEWLALRPDRHADGAAVSIYEVHLASWRRRPGARPRDGEPGWLSYRELADTLLPYVRDLGFTHVELMPITEHPLDMSWGYQTLGYFAPTARHGSPDDFRAFVDRAHGLGLGVILDWVPAHFPTDAHGLGVFDGTHLYEHADPRKGVHPDWRTFIFNYARDEVRAFLISSALHWIENFHIDGLRLDAVASMLYLDYSREEGQWEPNVRGGRENLEAVAFLEELNGRIHHDHPDVLVCAEESTAWPGVTHGLDRGGLGFDVKWNMGWMHDTLEVFQADPLFRKGLHHRFTFSLVYAFAERFLLPLSHDEVVHMKGSLLSKMPGGPLDKHATLRVLFGYMWAHPGRKLLFMGGELGTWREWDFEGELDWPLLEQPLHRRLQNWVGALNRAYREERALHEWDTVPEGFEWLDVHDAERSTISFVRWSRDWEESVVVVVNLTPVTWKGYRLAVPHPGRYEVLLDSDAPEHGGGGRLGADVFHTVPEPLHGRDQFLELDLPPLTVLFLKREGAARPPSDGEGGPQPMDEVIQEGDVAQEGAL
ncbi:MAG: 1,4-alpha-glucan branching protein GlgB [Gemmatimonadota bacterium]